MQRSIGTRTSKPRASPAERAMQVAPEAVTRKFLSQTEHKPSPSLFHAMQPPPCESVGRDCTTAPAVTTAGCRQKDTTNAATRRPREMSHRPSLSLSGSSARRLKGVPCLLIGISASTFHPPHQGEEDEMGRRGRPPPAATSGCSQRVAGGRRCAPDRHARRSGACKKDLPRFCMPPRRRGGKASAAGRSRSPQAARCRSAAGRPGMLDRQSGHGSVSLTPLV